MTRLAYLVGVTGSGKSHVAKAFAESVDVLSGDAIRRDVRNAAGLAVDYRWDSWRNVLRSRDLVPFVRRAVQDRYPRVGERDILIDGEMLGLSEWRHAVAAAVVPHAGERLFWLDPPPAVVLQNIRDRARRDQQDYTLEMAESSCAWFASELAGQPTERCELQADLQAKLRSYFLAD